MINHQTIYEAGSQVGIYGKYINHLFSKKITWSEKVAQGMPFRSLISDFSSGTSMTKFLAFCYKTCVPVRFCGSLHVEYSESQSCEIDRYQKNNFTAF